MIRFVYTGDVHSEGFEDPVLLHLELLVQGDYLALDSLFEYCLSFFLNRPLDADLFYELEGIYSTNVLIEPINRSRLLQMLGKLFSKLKEAIWDHPQFTSLSTDTLAALLDGTGRSVPVALLYRWNTFFDKSVEDLEQIRSLLAVHLSHDRIAVTTDPAFALVSRNDGRTLAEGTTFCLSSADVEVHELLHTHGRISMLIDGLKRNELALCGYAFTLHQTDHPGIYVVRSGDMDPMYLTGSSERIRLDVHIDDSGVTVAGSEWNVIRIDHPCPRFDLAISIIFEDEVNFVNLV